MKESINPLCGVLIKNITSRTLIVQGGHNYYTKICIIHIYIFVYYVCIFIHIYMLMYTRVCINIHT